MKKYRVHFSFYSEPYGEFDDISYKVEAIDRFEARRLAWAEFDADPSAQFRSCVKQCGVTWDASPLDLRDFSNNAEARAVSMQFKSSVCHSRHLPIGCMALVLRGSALPPNERKPENLLWAAADEGTDTLAEIGGGSIRVQNLITGEIADWKGFDFTGILRPEYEKNIKFKELQAEYDQQYSENCDEDDEEDEYGEADYCV